MKKNVLILLFFFCAASSVFSQSVGIGKQEFTPHTSAALEIKSSEKGFLVPRMTASERDAIASPAPGLLIFQNDGSPGFYFYDGTTWKLLGEFVKLTSGAGIPGGTGMAGDLYVDELTGDIYTSEGTVWTKQNKDNQTLSLTGNVLGIADGNTVDLSAVSISTSNIAEGAVTLSKLDGLSDGEIIIGTDGTATGNSKAVMSGDVTMTNAGVTSIGNDKVTTSKIVDGTIVSSDLSSMGASNDQFLKWNGTSWIPESVSGTLNYKGAWDASVNSPLLSDGDMSSASADYYVVSVAGNQDLGSGNISFSSGDWTIYNGTIWQQINNSSDVNSVFGRTGIVSAQTNDYTWAQIDKTVSSIADIADVGDATPSSGNFLVADGTKWNSVQASLAEVDGSVSNEGSLTVGPGTTSTSIISSNTSGSTDVTLEAGTNVELSEDGNKITISVDLSSANGRTPYGPVNPTTGTVGDIFYNTTDHTLYVYDGTNWIPVDMNGSIISNGTSLTLGNNSITETTLNGQVNMDHILHLTPGTAPALPTEGDIYMDAASHKLRCYDGTSWKDLW